MTEDEEFELLQLERERASYHPEMAPNTGAGGMGDVKMAESAAGAPPLPYQMPEYIKSQLSGFQPGAAKPAIQFAGDAANTLGMGAVNAAVQGVQDNWGHPLNAVGGVIANEAKNIAAPFHTFETPIQETSASLERMGVDNTPQPPPMRYPGEQFPGGNAPIPGLADQAGTVADMLAPMAGLEAIKAAGAASRAALSKLARGTLNSPGMRKAAERAVLDNYAPRLRKEFAPENPTPGAIENAPSELAKTLKESDLLYAPEKAKIKLNSGLEKIGGAIDRTIKQATEVDAVVNAKSVLDGYATTTRSVLTRTGKNAATIEEIEGKILPKIDRIVANLGPDELGNIPLDKGVEFRRALQDMVKNWDGDNKNLAQVVAKKLSSSMNEKIAAAHPVYGPRLAKLNDRYSSLKDAEPMIDEGFSTAYGKATGLDDNARGIPKTREGIVTRIVDAAMTPRQTLMKMRPGLAERVANDQFLPIGSAETLPQYIARPPTVTADELAALGMDIGPKPYALPPRTPQGRPALNQAPTYVERPPVPQAFGRPAPPVAPEYDPLAALDPRNRNPLQEAPQGVPGIEGMAPADYAAARQADAQATREALARQSRPVRAPIQPTEQSGGVQVLTPNELALRPRVPKGNVRPNGYPANLESPAVQKVLNESGRRPIVPNQARIDRLNEALKRAKTKEAREKLQALLREENYRFKKGKK